MVSLYPEKCTQKISLMWDIRKCDDKENAAQPLRMREVNEVLSCPLHFFIFHVRAVEGPL